MQKQTFTIDINAPKQKVWDTMLQDATYREWAAVFYPGSAYEGSWDEGSKIYFVGPGESGKQSGMSSRIVANTLHEFISIEHVGELVNGVEDTTSERVKQWAGSRENYIFTQNAGVTTLVVELEGLGITSEVADMFKGMWPPALAKLKEVAER